MEQKIFLEKSTYVFSHLDEFYAQLRKWLSRWCRSRKYPAQFFDDVVGLTGLLILESLDRNPERTPNHYWRSALWRAVGVLTKYKETPSDKLDFCSEAGLCMSDYTRLVSSGNYEELMDALAESPSLEPREAYQCELDLDSISK